MMRSMNSAVAGLRVHQTRMDVIANNLANVNTVGYKASRVNFTDVLSQELRRASGANEVTGRGGQNAKQVGLGVRLSAIDKRMTQGPAMRTDIPMDLMLNGEGFFMVGDASGTYFTRAGAFRLDPTERWLVNDQGMALQGWNVDDAFEIQTDELENIQLNNWNVDAQPTEIVQVSGNIDPTMPGPPYTGVSLHIYDSTGARWVMDVEFIPITLEETDSTPLWWEAQFGGAAGTTTLRRADDPTVTISVANRPNQILMFTPQGRLREGWGRAWFIIDPEDNPPDNATFGTDSAIHYIPAHTILIDFSELTQFSGLGSTVRADLPLSGSVPLWTEGIEEPIVTLRGGFRAGTFDSLSVGSDGIVRARFTNDQILPIAQIPIAVFRNAQGLESVGNNLFRESANSGDFNEVDAASVGTHVMGGALEMSNVNMAEEFTDMITTQRGFQSNARVIGVSDEMLQTINNM